MATRDRHFREVTYVCNCGHKQTVRFFMDDVPFPATCCVKCKNGFGNDLSYGAMAARGIGMQPGKPAVVNG